MHGLRNFPNSLGSEYWLNPGEVIFLVNQLGRLDGSHQVFATAWALMALEIRALAVLLLGVM
jgi:hypothetical protein